MGIFATIVIGGLAGWLGSYIFRGQSLGLIRNIFIGIIGGVVGSWLLGKIGLSMGGGWLGAIITGAIGAIVILALVNLIFGRRQT